MESEFNNLELWIISIALGISPIALVGCFLYIWSLK